MRKYRVDIRHCFKHGKYGADYKLITALAVTASNMEEAKEKALKSMIGKVAGKYDFPIDFAHAPEAHGSENGGWSMKMADAKKHIINEHDIALKGAFSVKVKAL